MIIKNIINALVIIFFTFFISDKSSANIKSYTCKSVNVLITLDEKYKTLTSTCTDRTVAANHNAYSYLAYRYDIDFVTVHGLDPEGEPSAEDVVKVVDRIKEDSINVLFVEEYTDQSSVQSIVDETDVDIQILYTMEMAPSDPSDDYLSMMNKNFDSLEAGMACSA